MTRPQFLNEVIRDERAWNARTAGHASLNRRTRSPTRRLRKRTSGESTNSNAVPSGYSADRHPSTHHRGRRAAWTYRLLPDACLEEPEQAAGEVDTDEGPVTDIVVRDERFPKCREAVQPMLCALETGLGFLIVDRLPIERHPLRRQQVMY